MLVDRIAQETGIAASYLELLARTALHRYKRYSILKRNGTPRLIAHPSRQLKFVQRWLTANLFLHFPVHAAAMAYRKGLSVRDNATIHTSKNYLLKLDITDFFPSIRGEDITNLMRKSELPLFKGLTAEDHAFIVSIVTRYEALPVGAPSSPVLSNAVMYDFDLTTTAECVGLGVMFTRYADDMFFSTDQPNVLETIHKNVVRRLRDMQHPRLTLNTVKTVHTSRRHRRIVTGLVLTSDRQVSLGRDNKRRIKSLLQKFRDNQLGLEDREYLSGYLAYASSVNSSFIDALIAKYGGAVVTKALDKTPEQPAG